MEILVAGYEGPKRNVMDSFVMVLPGDLATPTGVCCRRFYPCALLIKSCGKPSLFYIMVAKETTDLREDVVRECTTRPVLAALDEKEVDGIGRKLCSGELTMSSTGSLEMTTRFLEAMCKREIDEVFKWLKMGVNSRMDVDRSIFDKAAHGFHRLHVIHGRIEKIADGVLLNIEAEYQNPSKRSALTVESETVYPSIQALNKLYQDVSAFNDTIVSFDKKLRYPSPNFTTPLCKVYFPVLTI
jgi:hypothetical protein